MSELEISFPENKTNLAQQPPRISGSHRATDAAPLADGTTASKSNLLQRKKLLVGIAGLVAVAGAGYLAYDLLYASHFVSTDDAYTGAETAQVTPAISGIVRDVRVTDTQPVHRGDILVALDDTDARLALEQADAELGRAERRVKGYVANDESLTAQVAARASDRERAQAQVVSARADFERAKVDLERREALADSGSVSADEVTRARNAFETAKAAVAAAKAADEASAANRAATIGQRDSNAALIAGTNVENNPEVTLARAKRDQARVDLERTIVRAPIDGVVVKRAVQVGQKVQPGASLLSVVPVANMHVDANFKEVQLARIRVGQTVEVVSDVYGESAVYHGKIEGLAGGSGSAFSAIPAQNATGNWIKVVQRVPVRIALDPAELAQRPLGAGLSMSVTVDTRSGT